MPKNWFPSLPCNEIRIHKFKSISDENILSKIHISDQSVIRKFMAAINEIVVDGDEMKSFSESAEHIELEFNFENNHKCRIDIINGRFKTPSTGFNSSGSQIEADLYRDIDGLLFPDIKKSILKVENLELCFGNFSITYVNTDFIPQEPGGPTKGPVYKMNFLLHEVSTNKTMPLTSVSAQIPPQPVNFDVNDKQYILLTYKSIDQESLYPYYFQIIENQTLDFDSYVP